MPRAASPTTAWDKCLLASWRPTFRQMSRASGENAVQEPVVKSCSLVPMARITSASAAMALALSEPVTPIGPMFNECVASKLARPAMVSTTGMSCFSAKDCRISVALEYCTPPPAMIIGRLDDLISATAAAISCSSAACRRIWCTRRSKKLAG